jgi:hypothetical protein
MEKSVLSTCHPSIVVHLWVLVHPDAPIVDENFRSITLPPHTLESSCRSRWGERDLTPISGHKTPFFHLPHDVHICRFMITLKHSLS